MAPNAELERLAGAAEAHCAAGRWDEAEVAYRAALRILPGEPAVLHNLGVIAARRGDPGAALACFDAVLAVQPGYASAHYNRAVALAAVGRRKEAIEGFARALACDPELYAGHRAVAFCWLAEGNRGRALDHFARTYDLRRGEDRDEIARDSLRSANRVKLHHDAEQFGYLAATGRDPWRFEALSRRYADIARGFPSDVTPLSEAQCELLGETYNTAIHCADAAEIPGGALGPRPDRDALLEAFASGPAGAVHFDDLLSPRAFSSLRRYLLESTIWHDFSHIDGFVASYLEDGLACPLLLQIAEELRQAFPQLLGSHPLSQAWAFKGVAPRATIDAHADDAAISVNFWMTPDEANLDPGRGGLSVGLSPPPPDWAPTDYERDRARAVHFLGQAAQNRLTVPYRKNRAVLFESRLLHAADASDFRDGYENHRISVTLLFGRPRAAGRAGGGTHAGRFSERETATCQ